MKIQIEELRKRVALTAGLILLIISFGTFGYMFIEGWQFFDGLYMTIITLTTVGYREVRRPFVQGPAVYNRAYHWWRRDSLLCIEHRGQEYTS